MKMAVDPEFAKWAKGFSGCDGGNLEGSIWLCGIEWGLGKSHTLKEELQEDVTRPPQKYKNADDVRRPPGGRPYPFNTMFLKLVAAMRGWPLEKYKAIANEEPFPFHRESDYFKLNLFPVAFPEVDPALWKQYSAETGLSSRAEYLQWCRENRFPKIRNWVKQGQPKLIVCVGLSCIEDFHSAFGISGKRHEETPIQGRRLVWFADDTTTLAVVPFPTQSGLNSDQSIQAFGRRLSDIVGMKQERDCSPSPAPRASNVASRALSATDGWNATYSEPQSGAQTEFIEKALSDVPRTADEIATIANFIAGRDVVEPARVTGHLKYHHKTMGKHLRRGRQSRMPEIQHSEGLWYLPPHKRPKGI